jgi:hypothetical protein
MQLAGNLNNRSAIRLQSLHLGIPLITPLPAGLLLDLIQGATTPVSIVDRDRLGCTLISRLDCGGLQLRPQTIEHPFERFAKVAQDVPAVGHLDGIWRTFADTTSIFGGAITCDNLNARMALQPGRNCLCGSFWQQIDHVMSLTVDKNGSVHSTTTKCKIVQSEHARCRPRRRWGSMDEP